MIGRIVRVLLVVVLAVFVGLKFLPLGDTAFQSKLTGKAFAVPSLAVASGECCEYAAPFKSVRSVWSLEQEIEKILQRDYEEITCINESKVYYDETEDITVRAYTVKLGFPMNEVIVSYEFGRKC